MKKKRNVYWVSPNGERGWDVKKEGASRPLSRPPTKKQAVNLARQMASNAEPSQLFIQRKDGTIQAEHSYGNDPFPPRG